VDSLDVSVICLPEILSTLTRLTCEEKLTPVQYKTLKIDVVTDLGDPDNSEITADAMTHAVLFLESHPLRAMDAIYLACAMTYQSDVFVSADRRQIAAAKEARLNVMDVS
jgi:predicted nucleic acid-binding protein